MFGKKHDKRTHIQFKFVLVFIMIMSIMFTVAANAEDGEIDVVIRDGDNVISVETDQRDAYEIIGSRHILLGENDRLDLTGFDRENGGEIVVVRVCNITIVDHDKEIKVAATGSVYEALEKNGISYERNDVVDQNISKSVSDGMVINIFNGVDLKVVDSGETKIYGIPVGSNVNQALKFAGIELGPDDTLSFDEKTPVSRNMIVKIGRVEYRETSETQPIKYETVKKNVTSVPVGTQKVETQGKDGVKKVVYNNKYIDGVFAAKTVKEEIVTKEPVNEVVLVGIKAETTTAAAKAVQATTKSAAKVSATKTATTKTSTTKAAASSGNSSVSTISDFTLPGKYSLNSSNVPTSYKKKLTGSATAYYGGTCTSTGKTPQPGYIAVDPSIIPYGTEMWIVSNDGKFVYGYAIAADTGGFIYYGNTLCDLYFNTYDECVNFGRRDVTIYIL